jgi:hypothetical protein
MNDSGTVTLLALDLGSARPEVLLDVQSGNS